MARSCTAALGRHAHRHERLTARRRLFVMLLGCGSLAPGVTSAAIRSARVGWLPIASPAITGYNVYVRESDSDYGPPIDVGLPALTAGQMRRVVGGLDDTRDYVFAVTASLSDGTETGFSNEIALAASAPGSCAAATVIPPTGGTVTGTTTGSGTESGTCGATAAAPERVFAWTPATSGTATLATCDASATTFDTILYVRGNRCGGRELACSDDAPDCPADAYSQSGDHGSRVEMPVVAGTTYYIIVDGYAGASGDFSLTVTPPVPDPTCDATVLPPAGGTFTGTTSGTGREVASCEADTSVSPERVYQWTPRVSGTATIQTCNASATTFDTVVYVHGDSCTGPELACNDDAPDCVVSAYSRPGSQGSRVNVPVVAGNTYFIVVDGYGGGRGQFSLTVTPPVATTCDATVIPAQGGEFTGTTTGSDTETTGSCAATDEAPGRVYAWTPDASGIATIQTCNASATTFDTVLYVRGRSCFGPELACSDDAPDCLVSAYAQPGHQGSRVRLPVIAGTTYFIVVDGYGGASGGYALTVTPPGVGVTAAVDGNAPVVAQGEGPDPSGSLKPQVATSATATAGCSADPGSEGAGCETGDPCDPGVCRAAVCTPSSKAPHRPPLDVKRVALHRAGARLRVVTRASFASTTDPAKSGALVDLTGPDGRVLYRLQLPGAAFRANRARTRFRYVRTRAPKAVPRGIRLRRLTFRRDGAQLRMLLRATVPHRLVETAAPRISVGVRVGPECAREDSLGCESARGGLACH